MALRGLHVVVRRHTCSTGRCVYFADQRYDGNNRIWYKNIIKIESGFSAFWNSDCDESLITLQQQWRHCVGVNFTRNRRNSWIIKQFCPTIRWQKEASDKVTFLVKEQNVSVISTDVYGIPWCLTYSLNVQEWKSTLLGVILGITSFGVEIHAQNSGIHKEWFKPLLWSGFYYFRVDFHSKRSDP